MIVILSISAILFCSGFVWLNLKYEDTFAMTSTVSSHPYLSNPNFSVGDPIMNMSTFRYGHAYAKFVLYEDFPLKISDNFNKSNILAVNLPDEIWTKLLTSKDGNEKYMRLMGYVKPGTPNPMSQSLYIIDKSDNARYETSVPILRNHIINEISAIRDSTPIKFKNELFIHSNSTTFCIYGVVYDPTSDKYAQGKPHQTDLNADIEPIGMFDGGKLVGFPLWLHVKTIGLPITLKENEPNYYVLGLTTNNAPIGSYQVAVRELINNRVFIESITLTVV